MRRRCPLPQAEVKEMPKLMPAASEFARLRDIDPDHTRAREADLPTRSLVGAGRAVALWLPLRAEGPHFAHDRSLLKDFSAPSARIGIISFFSAKLLLAHRGLGRRNFFKEMRSGTRLRQLDQPPPTRAHEAIEADQD